MKRLYADIAILILFLLAPYWIYLPIMLAAVFFFPFYWEAIVFGFLIDSLYGARQTGGTVYDFPFAIGLTITVLISFALRDRLRLHA